MQPNRDQKPEPAAEDWPAHEAPRTSRGPAHFAILGALLISSASIVALALWVEPDPRGFGTHEQLGLGACRMLDSTGVPCPACGITTSVTLAAQGRVADSFLTQPMGPLLAFGVPLLTLWALASHRRGTDLYERFEERRKPWARLTLALALAAWLFKIASVYSSSAS